MPDPDPVVVYAMVTALIVAVAVGIFFATPLRTLLTGPDAPDDPFEPDDQPAAEGPWSTADPVPDEAWPTSPPSMD